MSDSTLAPISVEALDVLYDNCMVAMDAILARTKVLESNDVVADPDHPLWTEYVVMLKAANYCLNAANELVKINNQLGYSPRITRP